jgi:hypothetical protein
VPVQTIKFFWGQEIADLGHLAKNGRYTLVLSARPRGAQTGGYRVHSSGDYPRPETIVRSSIKTAGEVDTYRFRAVKRSGFTVRLTALDDLQGRLTITLPDSSVLGPFSPSVFNGMAEMSGQFLVQVFGDSGTTGDYRLKRRVRPPQSDETRREGVVDAW